MQGSLDMGSYFMQSKCKTRMCPSQYNLNLNLGRNEQPFWSNTGVWVCGTLSALGAAAWLNDK
jgi:hypothetical protein